MRGSRARMTWATAMAFALGAFARGEVALTVRETAGVDRTSAPVTTGVPFGAVLSGGSMTTVSPSVSAATR